MKKWFVSFVLVSFSLFSLMGESPNNTTFSFDNSSVKPPSQKHPGGSLSLTDTSVLVQAFLAAESSLPEEGEVEETSPEGDDKATDELQFYPDDETYIHLTKGEKDGIYWALKTFSLSFSSIYFFSELLFPIMSLEAQEELFPLFDPWCHNFISRSFQYSNGNYMPLCARCTGMNIGIFLGHFDSFIWDSFQIEGWTRWQQGLLHIGAYSVLILPMVIDGYVQKYKFEYTSDNPTRIVTGMIFGYAMTAIVDEVLQLILDTSSYEKRKK